MGPLVSRRAAGPGAGLHRRRHAPRAPASPSPASGPPIPAWPTASSSRPRSSRPHQDLRIAREEIFGPVTTVLPFETSTRSSRWPTTPSTAWPPPSGPATSARPSGRPGRSGPGSCGSTTASRRRPSRSWGGFKQSGIGRELGPYAPRRLPRVEADLHQPLLSAWTPRSNHPSPPGSDPDQLKLFLRSSSSPSLRARSPRGMIHLGDKLGLYRALAGAAGPSPVGGAGRTQRASTSAGCGSGCLQPGGAPGSCAPTTDGATFALTPEARRGPRRSQPPGLRHGPVRPAARAVALLKRAARLLPNGCRVRLRRPRPRGRRRRRARLRAVVPELPRARRPPQPRRCRRQARAAAGGTGGRRRLRRRGRGPASWPGAPERTGARATTSPATPWCGPRSGGPRRD